MPAGPRDSVRILHISDLHIGWQEQKDRRPQFLEFLRSVDPYPDVILATGDFCFNGESRNLRRAKAFLEELAGLTGVPPKRLFVVPGNHDYKRHVYPLSPKWARRKFDQHLGAWCAVGKWVLIEELNLSFCFFDSNQLGGFFRRILGGPLSAWSLARVFAGGRIGPAALRALREEYRALDQAEGDARIAARKKLNTFKVAVLHHHPLPIPVVGEGKLGVVLDAGDLMTQLIACDFDLVLHGHQHFPFRADVRYEPLWGAAAEIPSAIKVSGAGSLSRRERRSEHVNQFSLIDFDASDGRQVDLTFNSYSNFAGAWHAGDPSVQRIKRPHREAFVLSKKTQELIAETAGYWRDHSQLNLVVRPDGSLTCSYTITIRPRVPMINRVHVKCSNLPGGTPPKTRFTKLEGPADMEGATQLDERGFFYVTFKSGLGSSDTAKWVINVDYPEGSFKTSAKEAQWGKGQAPPALLGSEWFTHTVSVPTSELRMTIRFDGWAEPEPQPELGVWSSWEEGTVHFKERKRIAVERLPTREWVFNLIPPQFSLMYGWSWKLP